MLLSQPPRLSKLRRCCGSPWGCWIVLPQYVCLWHACMLVCLCGLSAHGHAVEQIAGLDAMLTPKEQVVVRTALLAGLLGDDDRVLAATLDLCAATQSTLADSAGQVCGFFAPAVVLWCNC